MSQKQSGKMLSHVLSTGWLGTWGLGFQLRSLNFWIGEKPKDAPVEQGSGVPQSPVQEPWPSHYLTYPRSPTSGAPGPVLTFQSLLI